MKKYQSLVFYIRNNNIKLDFNCIISNFVTPFCEIFHTNVDIINYYGDFFGESVEKECEYKNRRLFQNFFIDLNNIYLQQLSFFSEKLSGDEWPLFQICFKYKLNELELRIDFENENININIFNCIIDLFNNNNMNIISSFLYDYNDKYNVLLLCGSEVGFMTHKKRALLNNIVKHNNNFFNSIVGVFSLNYISKALLTPDKISQIIKIVDNNNYIFKEDGIIIQCCSNNIINQIEKLLTF